MKYYKITESEYNFIFENKSHWKYYNNFKKFLDLYAKDEIFGYTRLSSKETGLKNDIFVDDSSLYQEYNHPLWLYVLNGNNDIYDVIPISISYNPQILMKNPKLNFSRNDLRKIFIFIKKNKETLVDCANGFIDSFELIDKIRPINNINESILFEMANLMPSTTKLATSIWLDPGHKDNVKHNIPRIKFKGIPFEKGISNLIPISIEDDPHILVDNPIIELSSKEMQQLKKFIRLNKDNLIALYNNEITISDFKKLMIIIDIKGNVYYPETLVINMN